MSPPDGSACGPAGGHAPAILPPPALACVPSRRRRPTSGAVHIVCDCRGGRAEAAPPAASGTGTAAGCKSGRSPPAAPGGPAACRFYAAAGRRLYTFEEAPQVLQYNRFIRSGYRAGLSYPRCLRSICEVHNETGNILTHLLPAATMLALLACQLLRPWPDAPLEYWQNMGSIFLCFCLSVAYHSCMAHHHHYHTWLRLDVCGVLLVLVGSPQPLLWWGLHCHPVLRWAFTATYYAVGLACSYAAVTASSSLRRAVPMLVLLVLRVSGFVTRMLLHEHPAPALWHYFAMEAYSLVGGAINALHVPERWLQPADPAKPAPLDYWLNSHQIMHVCVALAMLHLHLGAEHDYHTVTQLRAGALQCAAQLPAAVAMLGPGS